MTINTIHRYVSLQASIIASELMAHVIHKASDFLCLLQLKNAESILEFERLAEISFEKRDFRMVSVFALLF